MICRICASFKCYVPLCFAVFSRIPNPCVVLVFVIALITSVCTLASSTSDAETLLFKCDTCPWCLRLSAMKKQARPLKLSRVHVGRSKPGQVHLPSFFYSTVAPALQEMIWDRIWTLRKEACGFFTLGRRLF